MSSLGSAGGSQVMSTLSLVKGSTVRITAPGTPAGGGRTKVTNDTGLNSTWHTEVLTNTSCTPKTPHQHHWSESHGALFHTMAAAHSLDEQSQLGCIYYNRQCHSYHTIPLTYTLCIYNIYTVDDTAKPYTRTSLDYREGYLIRYLTCMSLRCPQMKISPTLLPRLLDKWHW